jgi:FtsP/CotA-like multicopper oxidase with cupredoxin domain
MTEFNMWCWNSRVFPGIDPFVVGKNDKVRIRFGNLTMTNHPIHMHGYEFKVSCTDGGWVDPAAAWPRFRSTAPSARCAPSTSSPTSPATGRSIATSRTIP